MPECTIPIAARQAQLAAQNTDQFVVTQKENLLYLLSHPVNGILLLKQDTAELYTTAFFQYTDIKRNM